MASGGPSRLALLRAERDIFVRDGHFVAESDEPWLTLRDPCPAGWADRFIEVTFRASLLDEPARPIFRFSFGDGRRIDRIGAAPIIGAGIWIGRVPPGTIRISVSPTNRLGPFDFRIERLRIVSWWSLLALGFRLRPRAARSALLTRLIGWKAESDVNLAWAISAQPLEDYPRWSATRARSVEPDDLDRPRFDGREAISIRIIVVGDDPTALQRTLASLNAQISPNWTALVLADADRSLSSDPRIETCHPADVFERMRRDPGPGLTCCLPGGSVLLPFALAYVAEQAHRYPDCQLFYGDALLVTVGGVRLPRLQPGWSPRLQTATAFLAPPLFLRDPTSWPDSDIRAFADTGTVATAPTSSPPRPLRRILLEMPDIVPPETAPPEITSPKIAADIPPTPRVPIAPPGTMAAIIIPTRDQPALLRRVVASIRARTAAGRYRIVVVDNGSTSAEALALLDSLTAAPDVTRLDTPGPFSFSAMCNEAAATTKADVLVFLNDDMEVLSTHWLDRLVAHACDPGIGAVGAKLTYPDGRLQHVGVLVGMGESAGHFGALEPGDAPGWAGRNRHVHEVSAVTGACLAVARTKFDAIGGFDAEHLPVELSDIDLCLKLNARGWQTVVDPAVHLMHEESVSRGGATFRRLDVYARQRDIFVERWRHVLRDDPFFHPGLSLYSLRAALG